MHDHSHHHSSDAGSNNIAVAFFLNLGFSVIEFVGGYLTNSTAIMADAVHDLGDSLSIGLAWILDRVGRREANSTFTYGYQRFSLFGALINSVILVAGSVWVLTEAIPRLFDPVMPVAEGMVGLAILGVAVNGYAALRLSKGKSLNERALNWHLLEDVLGWAAVLVVAVVLLFVDWPILDPLLSIAFTLFILVNVVKMLWETLRIFAQSSPDAQLAERIESALTGMAEISRIHDLRLWSLDGEHHVMSVHVEMHTTLSSEQQVALKAAISRSLAPFQLAHTTVELEWPEEACRHL
ncbi:MAG TPA: cation transporter [Spongiibacteraceae bacterium]|nr:cation transporter [Spongiibacteraceae bacterium]HCS27436.1 cation transporter [Spongiibacteraceae bacterium]